MVRRPGYARRRGNGEAVNSGNLDALREVIAPRVVDHDPAPDQAAGPQGFIDFFSQLRTAFPDLAIAVDRLVAADDDVAIAYTITGTHQGEFLGLPATGQRIEGRGVQSAFSSNLEPCRTSQADGNRQPGQLPASRRCNPAYHVAASGECPLSVTVL